MPNRNLFLTILVILVITGLLSGCVNLGNGTERLPRLYVLTAIDSDANEAVVVAMSRLLFQFSQLSVEQLKAVLP